MLIVRQALIIGISLVVQFVQCTTKCEGYWTQYSRVSQKRYHQFGARTPFNATEEGAGVDNWYNEACPLEEIPHTCYEIGEASHANGTVETQESREWVFKSNDCLEFYPANFLESIRDRDVVFYGDSIMTQLYSALVCMLYKTTRVVIHPVWATEKMFGHGPRFACPRWPNNCYLLSAVATVRSANTTLHFVDGYYMDERGRENFKKMMHNLKLQSNDIVVMNVGMHSNNRTEHKEQMDGFFAELFEWENDRNPQTLPASYIVQGAAPNDKNPQSSLPHILFLETPPQHFPDSADGNGYFTEHMRYDGKKCAPLADVDLAARNDWRNTLLHDAARNVGLSDIIVPIASPLRSQWDVHVGSSPYSNFGRTLDCTHWCYPGGIYDAVFGVLFNHMLQLNITTLPVGYHSTESVRSYPEGTLIRAASGREIYQIHNKKKDLFNSFNAFASRGHDVDDVLIIPDYMMDFIADGETLY
jgi:GDSL/SGNH-like Acyl-Esterase family found in Pmr5 and Cas1p